MKRIDILGNGISNHLCKGVSNYAVGCNLPRTHIPVDETSVIDTLPLGVMAEGKVQFPRLVRCTEQVKKKGLNMGIDCDFVTSYERKSKWSAGLHSIDYWLPRVDQIHLWGFDSLVSGKLESLTDELVPRHKRPNLNIHWLPILEGILDKNPQKLVVVHCAEGQTLIQKDNLEVCYEKT